MDICKWNLIVPFFIITSLLNHKDDYGSPLHSPLSKIVCFCAIEVAIFEKYSFHCTFYDLFLLSSQVSLIWRRCIWRRNAIKEDSTARQLIFFAGINFLSKHSLSIELWQLISVVNQLKHWDFFSESSFCHFSCFLSLAFRWTCDEC